jgi:hypothetical protein
VQHKIGCLETSAEGEVVTVDVASCRTVNICFAMANPFLTAKYPSLKLEYRMEKARNDLDSWLCG